MVRTNRKICRLLSHNVRLTFTVCRQFVHRCVITCSFRPISNSETVICLYIINSHLLFDCTMISLHFLCLHRTLRTLVREELGCHSVAAWLFECSSSLIVQRVWQLILFSTPEKSFTADANVAKLLSGSVCVLCDQCLLVLSNTDKVSVVCVCVCLRMSHDL